MCQKGQSEIAYCRAAEREAIREKYLAYERGEINLSDDEVQKMAVRMIMLREQ